MDENRGTGRHTPDSSDDSRGRSPERLLPASSDAPELPDTDPHADSDSAYADSCPDCLAHYRRDRFTVTYTFPAFPDPNPYTFTIR